MRQRMELNLKERNGPEARKKEKKPKLQWLDESIMKYYRHVVHDRKYDFIIGHAPYLANGCLNLKDFYKEKDESAKIIIVFHGLPKIENRGIDDETLLDWLNEADIIFSVGKAVENELLPYITALDPEKKPVHKIYIPSYPLETLCS